MKCKWFGFNLVLQLQTSGLVRAGQADSKRRGRKRCEVASARSSGLQSFSHCFDLLLALINIHLNLQATLLTPSFAVCLRGHCDHRLLVYWKFPAEAGRKQLALLFMCWFCFINSRIEFELDLC